MIKTKQVSDVMNISVYTDSGDYFGEVEETSCVFNENTRCFNGKTRNY